MDMLNNEQRDAVKTCARIGHRWHTIDGREYCACCGWPRDLVRKNAGGLWKGKEEPEQGVCDTCKHLRPIKFTYRAKSTYTVVCGNDSTLDDRFKYPDTGTAARPCAGWEVRESDNGHAR